MSNEFEVRDPIHGFIERGTTERDIVDTSIFQRLRRLRQLAMAYLVYPGATHTRFSHSLGAFHIAGKMISKLTKDEDTKRLVKWAALLHDIGHGPFSHVAEPILKLHSPKDKLPKDEHKIHELIGQQIILTHEELDPHLTDKHRQKIVDLLDGKYGESFLHDIVSGPMDADKQDYLLRDSYFAGVKYGIYDMERLHNTFFVHEDEEAEDTYLAISIDGLHALEQFVLAKYYMTTQVYRHKIRLITDQMIERAIRLGIANDAIPWMKALYTYDGSKEYLAEYLKWNDERLINKVLDEKDGYAKTIFLNLYRRRLFKCILDAQESDFSDPEVRSYVFQKSKAFFTELEARIAKKFEFDPNLVIAYRISFDSATKTESQVSVIHKSKNPTIFKEESALFRSVDEKIREQRFLIFAPVEYSDDEKLKRKRMKEYREGCLEAIADLADLQLTLQPGAAQ